ncbi:hypothetical protein ACFWZ1_00910 [Frateuria sp. GZRe14]|uniref:hypothetical protein n=1 Tax=Frateuria sp. GZRe14 TaxID=3351534 RepID=UPI003EDC4476
MSREPDSHESYLVAAGVLHWAAAILALSLLAIVLLVYAWARPVLTAGEPPTQPIPPQPRLQPDPAADIAAERALQRSRLDGYMWADKAHTVARIPITRAMAMVAAGQGGPVPASSTERPR